MGGKEKRGGGKASPVPLAPLVAWKTVGCGAAAVVLGFLILPATATSAGNWASITAPALLAVGYGVMAAGALRRRSAGRPDHPPTR